MARPVIVGVDDSQASTVAVEAAAREASLRGVPLHVLHAYKLVLLDPPVSLPPGTLQDIAEQIAAEAAAHARAVEPDLEIQAEVELGEPLAALEAASRRADLVVVGNRGRNAFTGLLLGSIGVQLAAHAHCPVMVTRDLQDAGGPVVLGVDGSAAGEPAVDFAFNEAAIRGCGIIAVHAWTPWNAPAPLPDDPSLPYAAKPGELAAQEERLLAETVAGRREKHPDVEVERRSVRGDTRKALIEASAGAQLVVVGSRGRGGFTGLLLGSVSQAVLHHAHCSVVVVPHSG